MPAAEIRSNNHSIGRKDRRINKWTDCTSLLQLPDLRIRECHIGRVRSIFSKDPDFAGGEGAVAGSIDELAVGVKVQVGALRNEREDVGLVESGLKALRNAIEQTFGGTGLVARIDEEIIRPVRIDAEQVIRGVVGIGAEQDATFIPLCDGHLHLESKV